MGTVVTYVTDNHYFDRIFRFPTIKGLPLLRTDQYDNSLFLPSVYTKR